MSKPVVLLIDYNNLIFRALHAHSDLSHGGIFTGGFYGFLTMLAYEVNNHKVDYVVLCHDAKPYHREKETKGSFKKNRKELDPEIVEKLQTTKQLVYDLVQMVNAKSMKREGWEADDCIAQFCRKKAKKCKRILIMSNDSDLYQLLYMKNVYLLPKSGPFGYDRFRETYPSITPKDWTKVIALAGGHNNIPGIDTVGDKTAAKLIASGRSLKDIGREFATATKGVKKKDWTKPTKKQLKFFVEQAKFRAGMARLPLEGYDDLPKTPKLKPWNFNEKKFRAMLDEINMKVTPQIISAMKRLSKGED